MADLNEKTTENVDSAGTKEKIERSAISPPPVGFGTIVTRDGVRVHPQPTIDPLDPLNWSSVRKNSILAITMIL